MCSTFLVYHFKYRIETGEYLPFDPMDGFGFQQNKHGEAAMNSPQAGTYIQMRAGVSSPKGLEEEPAGKEMFAGPRTGSELCWGYVWSWAWALVSELAWFSSGKVPREAWSRGS